MVPGRASWVRRRGAGGGVSTEDYGTAIQVVSKKIPLRNQRFFTVIAEIQRQEININ
jgi:hypothetical protein